MNYHIFILKNIERKNYKYVLSIELIINMEQFLIFSMFIDIQWFN